MSEKAKHLTSEAPDGSQPEPSQGHVGLVSRWRESGFVALLMAAMVAGTLGTPTGGALSSFLIDDIEISRTQLGIVLGLVALVGALASPFAGRLVDLTGSRHGLAAVFLLAACGMVALGSAHGFATLVLFAAGAGMAQSLANPSTNTAIVERMTMGRRGLATGLKQSGVQVGVFLTGLLAPSAAIILGWRRAVLALALVLATMGVAIELRGRRTSSDGLRPRSPRHQRRVEVSASVRSQTRMLALYGGLIGLCAGFISLLPLYVSDVAGEGPRFGGYLIAIAGATAVVARIGWATLAERTGKHYVLLMVLGVGSGFGAILLMLGEANRWILWVAAATLGVSAASWNAVGMVTVMRVTHGRGDTGAVSGWVYFGFLLGVSLTGPLAGASKDHLGSYRPILALMVITSILSSAAALVARRESADPTSMIDRV